MQSIERRQDLLRYICSDSYSYLRESHEYHDPYTLCHFW